MFDRLGHQNTDIKCVLRREIGALQMKQTTNTVAPNSTRGGPALGLTQQAGIITQHAFVRDGPLPPLYD